MGKSAHTVTEEEYVGIFNPVMWQETHAGSWGFVLFCIFLIYFYFLTKNQTWIRGMRS